MLKCDVDSYKKKLYDLILSFKRDEKKLFPSYVYLSSFPVEA